MSHLSKISWGLAENSNQKCHLELISTTFKPPFGHFKITMNIFFCLYLSDLLHKSLPLSFLQFQDFCLIYDFLTYFTPQASNLWHLRRFHPNHRQRFYWLAYSKIVVMVNWAALWVYERAVQHYLKSPSCENYFMNLWWAAFGNYYLHF